MLEFESGAIGSFVTTFDVCSSKLPHIEIYGSKGTIIAPDPNNFGGSISIRKKEDKEWNLVDPINLFIENSRGLGLSDMSKAIHKGGIHRASGELAFHVLEVMNGIQKSILCGNSYEVFSTCLRPEPFIY